MRCGVGLVLFNRIGEETTIIRSDSDISVGFEVRGEDKSSSVIELKGLCFESQKEERMNVEEEIQKLEEEIHRLGSLQPDGSYKVFFALLRSFSIHLLFSFRDPQLIFFFIASCDQI